MREFQPRGPYHLGGSSFGGKVAYEMAQQLVRSGQEVALLALFDTHGPGYPKYLPTTSRAGRFLRRQWMRVQLHTGNLWLLDDGRWSYIRDRWRKLKRGAGHRWQAAVRAVRARLAVRSLPTLLRDVRRSGERAQKAYVPAPYGGKVVLFRAMSQPKGIYEDRTNGFGSLCDLEIIEIPGHHGAIVRDPRARYLTEKLVGALESARKRASQPA